MFTLTFTRILNGWLAVSLCASVSLAQTVLPKPAVGAAPSVEASLNARRSIRSFEPLRLPLRDLGQLLWAAQGITAENGHRTAPSAGATYPLELYVVVQNVEGIEPGVYHYRPAGHRLDRTAGKGDVVAAARGQKWIGDAAAVFVFAAASSRTATKYGEKADRYVAIEAGAAAENLALEAVALNLGTCFVGSFDAAAVRTLAGMPSEESPVILLPAGKPRR